MLFRKIMMVIGALVALISFRALIGIESLLPDVSKSVHAGLMLLGIVVALVAWETHRMKEKSGDKS